MPAVISQIIIHILFIAHRITINQKRKKQKNEHVEVLMLRLAVQLEFNSQNLRKRSLYSKSTYTVWRNQLQHRMHLSTNHSFAVDHLNVKSPVSYHQYLLFHPTEEDIVQTPIRRSQPLIRLSEREGINIPFALPHRLVFS